MPNALVDIAASYFLPSAETATPAQLYDLAVPRVQRALKQYDNAAPLIDFATQYWWLVAILAFGLGIGASVAGQAIYKRIQER